MKDMRTCRACGEAKPETLEFFSRHSTHPGGLNAQCKVCRNTAAKAKREAHPDAAKARARDAQARYRARHRERLRSPEELEKKARQNRAYRSANPEIMRKFSALYRQRHPEEFRATIRRWQERNRERVREIARAWTAANKKKVSAKARRYRLKNLAKDAEKVRRWREANPETARQIAKRRYEKVKTEHGPAWLRQRVSTMMRQRVSTMMRQSLVARGHSKRRRKWETLVGYTAHDLRRHLEKQFTRGMSWDNWGTLWHIDHIQPVASFRYTSAEDPEFRACWALSNLRPLLATENLSKGRKRTLLL